MARRLSLSHPVPLLWQPLSHSKGQGAGLAGGQGAGSVCLLCCTEISGKEQMLSGRGQRCWGKRCSVSWLRPADWEGRGIHQEQLPSHLKVFVCVWGGV